MRQAITLAALLLASAAIAQTSTTLSALQSEVLVLTTAVEMPRHRGRSSIEVQNLGPNPIWCGFSSGIVANKAHRVDATSGTWSLEADDQVRIWCIALANQVTGAASVVTELR